MRADSLRARFQWPQQLTSGAIRMDGLETALWLVVGLSLVGDVVTTFVGLHLGLAESNPVARGVIDSWGLLGMLALKAGAVVVALACRTVLERTYRPIIPAALALPWVTAVAFNVYLISSVL